MWHRKTQADLVAEEKTRLRLRWSPILPFFLSFAIGLVGLIATHSFWAFFILSAIGWLLIYLYRIISGNRGVFDFLLLLIMPGTIATGDGIEGIYFCPTCREPQNLSPTGCKLCGSTLEKISGWKWVPEKTETEA